MCQSLVTEYQFCGCKGATYEQKCPEPSSICELILAQPSPIKIQCYCEKHSSQTFKSRREDERKSKRIDREYQKILRRERERLLEEKESALRKREEENEALKYEEFVAMDRRKGEEYRRRRADKRAGLRPGLREKSDGICRLM